METSWNSLLDRTLFTQALTEVKNLTKLGCQHCPIRFFTGTLTSVIKDKHALIALSCFKRSLVLGDSLEEKKATQSCAYKGFKRKLDQLAEGYFFRQVLLLFFTDSKNLLADVKLCRFAEYSSNNTT